MERRTVRLTGKVWINEYYGDLDFELWADISGQRTYTLKQFMMNYLDKFFGESCRGEYEIAVYEPRTSRIVFNNTERGRELATMFKLGHECL